MAPTDTHTLCCGTSRLQLSRRLAARTATSPRGLSSWLTLWRRFIDSCAEICQLFAFIFHLSAPVWSACFEPVRLRLSRPHGTPGLRSVSGDGGLNSRVMPSDVNRRRICARSSSVSSSDSSFVSFALGSTAGESATVVDAGNKTASDGGTSAAITAPSAVGGVANGCCFDSRRAFMLRKEV